MYRNCFFAWSACLFMAGLLIVTLPSEYLPSIAWRLHFGFAEMFLGIGAGIGISLATRKWLFS